MAAIKTENGEKKIAPVSSERWLDLESMQRFFEDLWSPMMRPWSKMRHHLPEMQMPALDMHKEGSNLVIKAALPGMAKDEIKLNVTGHILTIEAEHKDEKKSEEKGRYLSEIHHGRIYRSLQLPLDVDASKIAAEHKDGMLTVTMPVVAANKSKTHNVEIK